MSVIERLEKNILAQICYHQEQWGHSGGSAATESKVLAGRQIDWRDYRLAGQLSIVSPMLILLHVLLLKLPHVKSLADPGKARGCSANTVVIYWLIDSLTHLFPPMASVFLSLILELSMCKHSLTTTSQLWCTKQLLRTKNPMRILLLLRNIYIFHSVFL